MAYREFRPREELLELVVCTWERVVASHGAPAGSLVLPDGCVDLIWSGDRPFVAGPDRGPVAAAVRPGGSIVGLRLRPGVAGRALGLPARELRDARVALEDVWGSRPSVELAGRIAAADSPAGRRRALEDAILSRLPEIGEPDRLVLAATRRLGLPGTRVDRLSGALAISERQLLRRFDAAVGYGPKVLDRVPGFRRLLERASRTGGEEGSLARLAADLGYADQAHLSRECVRLSGLTPARLLAGRGG